MATPRAGLYDLDDIAAHLRQRAEEWIPEHFPYGRRDGGDWRGFMVSAMTSQAPLGGMLSRNSGCFRVPARKLTAFWKNTGFRPSPTAESTRLIIWCRFRLGGGADSDDNLWPEPRRSIEPVWNAERKDRLEWYMADLVCSGKLDLPVAQEAIRANWIEAYERYVGEASGGR
jgi:hypothetical protein